MLNYLLIVLLTFLTRPYIRHEKKKQLEPVDILHTFFGRIISSKRLKTEQLGYADSCI